MNAITFGSEIGIRTLTDADLSFVVAVLNREIETSPYVYADVPVTLDERRAWLATHRLEQLPVVVAHGAGGEPLGWASLSVYRSATGYRFTVEASVYVVPAAQRRGVATRLLGWLEDWARTNDRHAIVASIDADNAASIALFERFGYAEVGRLPAVGRKLGAWRTQVLLEKVIG